MPRATPSNKPEGTPEEKPVLIIEDAKETPRPETKPVTTTELPSGMIIEDF